MSRRRGQAGEAAAAPSLPKNEEAVTAWAPIMTDTQLAMALGWNRRKLKRQGWPCTKVGNDWVFVVEDVIRHLRKYGRGL